MGTEHHIVVNKTARYFQEGDIEDGKHLIITLHGYGHLTEFFIRKFKALNYSKYVVICPEGLHRFYLDDKHSRVGASWMTKVDRENDISDYVSYLDKLLDDLKSKANFNSISLLGFSQGGATAARWQAYGKHSFDRFLLWATVFPPDMEPEYSEKFKSSKNYFIFGTKDEYYTVKTIQKHFHELGQLNIQFDLFTFEGNHDIHEETLLTIFNA